MRKAGRWQLAATPLGQEVLREDAFFSEPLTLWLLHLMLCRRADLEVPATGVADVWFALFAEGRFSLGARFTEADFHRLLVQRYGEKGYLKGLSTLVPRMYAERASFGEAGILPSTSAQAQVMGGRSLAARQHRRIRVYFRLMRSIYGCFGMSCLLLIGSSPLMISCARHDSSGCWAGSQHRQRHGWTGW